MKTTMNRYIKVLASAIILTFITSLNAVAQNVIENEEALLKEFDMESFRDAGFKIKDSSALYSHMVGIKWGYSLSSVSFSNTKDHEGVRSVKNYGIYYTFLHSLLGFMPYFGFQTGLATTEIGYTHVSKIDDNTKIREEQIYSAIELPMISVFRVDVPRVRLSLGIGGYISYIYGTSAHGGIIPDIVKRGNFGLMGQGGIALKLKPVEIFVEASYKYGLTPFLNYDAYSKDYWVYTHPTQLQFSAGMNFVIGRNRNKKK